MLKFPRICLGFLYFWTADRRNTATGEEANLELLVPSRMTFTVGGPDKTSTLRLGKGY